MNELERNKLGNTMSSKRIAERTGKEHGHVLRDIKNMIIELDDPNLDDSDYQEVIDNRLYISEILLNERLSLCLASGYSIKLRMAIINKTVKVQKIQRISLSIKFSGIKNPSYYSFNRKRDVQINSCV